MFSTIKDGKFTGVQYQELTQNVIDYHKENNLDYIFINRKLVDLNTEVDEEGNQVGEPDFGEPTAEEKVNQARADMVKAVEEYIQSEVNKYNEANGVMFKDIDACAKYTTVPTYTHYQFCVDVITWNVNVWETSRAIEAEVLAGNRQIPTVEELVLELPVFGEQYED